ncbi:MAG: tRNA (adenosine(37)-N6)-dimethylallyltransferase MiaA [Oscillospiraceae bacterium]
MQNKIPLIVVAGPTASGKTETAIYLAKEFNGEIISADSKKYFIATAKPTKEEMQGIPHHLMDFLNPCDEFSVGKFVLLAKNTIEEIYSRGKIPIVAGGTGLYISSLINNINFLETDEDKKIRETLNQRLKFEGIDILYNELKNIDPDICNKIHKNNEKRVLRALEIFYQTGMNMTFQIEKSKQLPSEYKLCMIALTYRERNLLYERINKRVDLMVEAELIKEATEFFKDKTSSTAIQAIGYKELKPYLDGNILLDQALENLKQATRRYAKRQLTWFRKDERYNWIYQDDYENKENILKKIKKTVEDTKIL